MKALTETQLFELCPASDDALQRGALLLGRTFQGDEFFRESAWLLDGVKAGHYTATTVKAGGVDRFLFAHHTNQQNALVLNAAVQLTPRSDFNLLFQAGIELARRLNCRAVEFVTRRAGLVKQAVERGFKSEGVLLSLPV